MNTARSPSFVLILFFRTARGGRCRAEQGMNRKSLSILPAGLAFACCMLLCFSLKPHSAITFLSLAANLAIAVVVFLHDPKNRLHRVFALWNVCFALDSLLLLGLELAQSPHEARFWALATGIGLYMIPPTSFHFTLLLTKDESRYKSVALKAAYAASAAFFATSFLPAFAKEYHHTGYTYAPKGNVHYTAFLAFLAAMSALTLAQIVSAWVRSKSASDRTQYKFFLIASVTALVFGGSTALHSYGVEMYPPASVGFVIYAGIISYAILRHRFLDVEILVKKGVAYFILTTLVTLLYAGIIVAGNSLFGSSATSSAPLGAFAVVLAALLFDPLRERVQAFVDRRFYRRRYSYRRTLRTLSAEIPKIIGRPELASTLAEKLVETMQVSRSCFLLPDGESPGFAAAVKEHGAPVRWFDSPGPVVPPPDLMSELARSGGALDRDGLLSRGARVPPGAAAAHSWLSERGFDLAVPVPAKETASGALLLGPKLSGEGFTREDADLIEICSSQAGAALENSSLYDRTLSMKNYFDRLAGSMTLGLLTLDAGGRIVTLNRAGAGILGTPAPAVEGKDVRDAFPGVGYFARLSGGACGAGGDPSGPEEFDFAQGGERKTISATASALPDRDDRPSGTAVLFADVTEKKQMENLLERTRRLAYLGEMASGIAHEIKNPLGSIKIFIESFNEHYRDPEFRRTFSSLVIPEIDGLDRMVRDLLEYAKPASLLRAEVDLDALLSSVLKHLKDDLDAMGVSASRECRGPQSTIRGDGEKLKRAFSDLVRSRALAASGSGGRSLSISLSSSGGFAAVDVLGGEWQEPDPMKMFVPFPASGSAERGLGLALALKTVEDHGGGITSARSDKGLLLTVTLPASEHAGIAPDAA